MVTDGSSQTILFGERNHHDPNFETFAARSWSDSLNRPGAVGGDWRAEEHRRRNHERLCPDQLSDARRFRSPGGGNTAGIVAGRFFIHEQRRVCAFGSGHPGGANFASGRRLGAVPRRIAPLDTLQALCTRNSRELISGY